MSPKKWQKFLINCTGENWTLKTRRSWRPWRRHLGPGDLWEQTSCVWPCRCWCSGAGAVADTRCRAGRRHPGTGLKKAINTPQAWEQVLNDQIGRFFKVIGGKFSYISSPNTWWILGFLLNSIVEPKTTVATFWATFRKALATFNFSIW